MVAPGRSRPVGGWPSRRIQRQVHGAQQAGLADGGDRVGGHDDVGLTETSTSACQLLNFILPTLPTTTSSIMTGEFDSSVPTLAISTW